MFAAVVPATLPAVFAAEAEVWAELTEPEPEETLTYPALYEIGRPLL